VLDFAKAHGQREGENLARWRGHLDKLLPKRQKLTRGHFAAMAYREVPAFTATLRGREGIAAMALVPDPDGGTLGRSAWRPLG
jgi:hypothetical protein